MQTKIVEIRDSRTYIPALAIQMLGHNFIQQLYMSDAGYPSDGSSIMLMVLSNGKATNDPYDWPSLNMGTRTMPVAHDYILNHFGELSDGEVIDVEFILGESIERKMPQRLERLAKTAD